MQRESRADRSGQVTLTRQTSVSTLLFLCLYLSSVTATIMFLFFFICPDYQVLFFVFAGIHSSCAENGSEPHKHVLYFKITDSFFKPSTA